MNKTIVDYMPMVEENLVMQDNPNTDIVKHNTTGLAITNWIANIEKSCTNYTASFNSFKLVKAPLQATNCHSSENKFETPPRDSRTNNRGGL